MVEIDAEHSNFQCVLVLREVCYLLIVPRCRFNLIEGFLHTAKQAQYLSLMSSLNEAQLKMFRALRRPELRSDFFNAYFMILKNAFLHNAEIRNNFGFLDILFRVFSELLWKNYIISIYFIEVFFASLAFVTQIFGNPLCLNFFCSKLDSVIYSTWNRENFKA